MQNDDANLPEAGENPVIRLAARLGVEWQNIQQAMERTTSRRNQYAKDWHEFCGEDRSLVVFGSLARGEFTGGSDVDWTLLVDGKADPTHLEVALEVGKKVSAAPGREGVFGNLAFSHEIVHCIGGEDDSNANTTRRILLLLESRAVGEDKAWKDVRKNILHRYLTEDMGLWHSSNPRGLPLFLLNDISRYWRTMTVDFAYKQRTRNYDKYALRSLKLGFSRKLIYLSGVLACMRCDLEFPEKQLFADGHPQRAIEHLEKLFAMTPLELFADSLMMEPCFGLEQNVAVQKAALEAFTAYDAFLEMLADTSLRNHFENLRPERIEADEQFARTRNIRKRFSDAVKQLFLRIESPVQQLMLDKGVM